MKRIFFFLFFSSVVLSSLAQPVGRIPQILGTAKTDINVKGSIYADSALGIPNKDTNFIPLYAGSTSPRPGFITRRPQDGKLYYYDTVGVDQWKPIADLSQLAILSVGKKPLYDSTGKIIFQGGIPTEVKLKPVRVSSRFGAEDLDGSDDTSVHRIETPKVVGAQSNTELRTISTLAVTDTQFVFRVTNYTLNYVQDYQYDPFDVTSTDNNSTLIVAGTKRFRAIFPAGIVNVKLFGAKGDGVADDQPSIQAAVDAIIANPKLPKNLYLPKGDYHIYAPIMIYKWDGFNYQQASINLIGQDNAHWNDFSMEARIRPIGIGNLFAIGIQQGRSIKIKGIEIEGQYSPAGAANIGADAYYKQTWAQWGTNYGAYQDRQFGPYGGIVIDPFGTTTGLIPPDSGYYSMASWYRGTGANAGSSGVTIEECRIRGFIVDIAISPGLVQNGENIIIRSCALEVCKAAVSSGQAQNKDNYIYNCTSWERTFACLSNDYGNGHGAMPYVKGWNIAGDVVQFVHSGSAYFPVNFDGVFAEALFKIGDIQAGSGTVSISNSNFDFQVGYHPYPIPDYHFLGDNVKFSNCTIRYYDDSANRRLYFKGVNISFDHCWFDKPPYGKWDHVTSSSLPLLSYTECTTFNNELLGWSGGKGIINPGGYKIVEAGKSIDLEDGGQLTVDAAGLRTLKIHVDAPPFQKSQPIGVVNVTVDTLQLKGTFTVAVGSAALIAVGDYLVYGTGYDSAYGRIQSVNYSTGVVNVIDIPLGLKSGNRDLVAIYYSILRGGFICHTTNGSPTLDSVKFISFLPQPQVGDRAGVGYPEGIITSVGTNTIGLSVNAYTTQSQVYRPFDRNERIEVTSYYDPDHTNLDGWNFIMPQNVIWKIWTSPYTNIQHTYKFSKGGYLHMSTVSGSPTYWQSAWQLTADDNSGEFSISQDGSINIPKGPIKFDANTQIQDVLGAVNINTQNATPKFTVTTTGVTHPGNVAYSSWQTITSGTATTIGVTINTVRTDPASVLASHTITMPASPVDGQEIKFVFGGTITAGAAVVTSLTISANTGQGLIQTAAPTTANAGDCFIYQYNLSNTKWYRIK
jgi:hypothetical protein